jgi:2',3'-cyclic-nucleotide 2'-phosphodiesterase (5'-nucleotidase family)
MQTVSAGSKDKGGNNNDSAVELTLIHIGDIHGHLIPRPHLRSDGNGKMQGGLARLYSKIEDIREDNENTLLINTGDTIQGSAEALHTQGQALVDVINKFDIDFFAPGNWDFVYGTERFQQLFAGKDPQAPWNGLAANLYFNGAPYENRTGERVLPPYKIITIDGVKIGVLGFTAERGPKAIGAGVVRGFRYSRGDAEMAEFVPLLRPQVDVLLVISELG